MSVAIPRKLYQPLAIAVALVFVYSTVLLKLSRDWWNDENYSHGLLIPFVIGYIIWQERRRLAEIKVGPAACWGAAGVGASMLMLWAGVAGAELFVQRLSLVLMIAGVLIYFWGFRLLRLVAVPLSLLVLSIPIPQIIFNRIAFPLQIFASRCAVGAMSFFSIPVLRQGNIIELMPLGASEPKRLAVVEACSGIRSLMTLVTLAVVYAYFTKPKSDRDDDMKSDDGRTGRAPHAGRPRGDAARPRSQPKIGLFLKNFTFWRSLLLVLASVPIAILTNAVRVSGTGVLAHYYGTRVADGFFHTFSGWVIYIAAAVLLFATGWALDRFARLGKRSRTKTAVWQRVREADA